MKTASKIIAVLILSMYTTYCWSQKPEPVYSIIRQIHDFGWYEQQAKAWKHEIDRGTKDKMAWVYWFKANRMAEIFCDHKEWENRKGTYFLDQSDIIKLAEKAIPNSFELYFLKINDDKGGAAEGDEYIAKAQALKPYDNLLLPWLVNRDIFRNNKADLQLTCQKWFDSNEMPQELLITAYNNLISLDPNAILLVNGDNETYPAWVLQNAKKVRPDVLVLNVSLSINDSYREWVFKENGIPPLTFKNGSERRSENIVKHLIENVHNKPIYISSFAPSDIYKAYTDKFYSIGLSYKYSEKSFDNLAVLRNNVENKYLLDFIKQSFCNHYAQTAGDQMEVGYIPVFLKLYDHYLQSGELQKAEKLKSLAETVALKVGVSDLMKYFEK